MRGLSYVVPAYNEENGIVSTVTRLKDVLSTLDLPWEIIVVNDGSRDGTRARLAECEDVTVVSHPINIGYGSAIKSGISAARYDWVGIVDADGTYAIESLPLLVEKMEEGFDMVVAARKNVLTMDKPFKRLFRKLLITFMNFFIAARIADPNSGFRIFRRSLALGLFPFLCNTFSFTTSLTVFALGEKNFVAYVPIEYSVRTGKSKVRHGRDSIRMIQLVLQGIAFFNPLKIFLLIGALMAVFFALPAMGLAAAGFETAGLYWFLTGALGSILGALALHADIVRISSLPRH